MFRRIVTAVLVVSMFLAFGLTAFAAPPAGDGQDKSDPGKAAPQISKTLSDIITGADVKTNDKVIVKITMPDDETDSTYEKSYIISGVAVQSDAKVYIAKYNEETGAYEPFENADGVSSWDAKKGIAFSKEIILSKGANKIKIVACDASADEKVKAEDIQVSCFTISLWEKSVKTIIKNTIDDIKSLLK